MANPNLTAGPGRPKGLQNKLTRTVKEAFQEAFDHLQSHPNANLKAWGAKNPDKFYPIASKLIPIDTNVQGNMSVQWPLPKTGLDD